MQIERLKSQKAEEFCPTASQYSVVKQKVGSVRLFLTIKPIRDPRKGCKVRNGVGHVGVVGVWLGDKVCSTRTQNYCSSTYI